MNGHVSAKCAVMNDNFLNIVVERYEPKSHMKRK